jgi:hypothetical protein
MGDAVDQGAQGTAGTPGAGAAATPQATPAAAGAAAAGQPAAGAAGAGTGAAAATPAATAGAAASVTPEPELSGKVLPEDAEDEAVEKYVDKDGNVRLPFKAFQTRIRRASKKELKAIFGTDNRDEILKVKTGYEALLTEKEKERVAQLGELEKEREEKKKAVERAEALERAAAEREERELVVGTEGELTVAASKHFTEDYVDFALEKFKKHLATMDDDDIDSLTDKEIDAFFGDLAKKRPAMAKTAAAADPDKKVPINNGANVEDKPAPAGGAATAKTARPGQPNTMSKEEIKRGLGYSW